jgi:hypothetical protein
VVTHLRHRLHHVQRRPKDWDAFFAAAPDDPPHEEGLREVARLARTAEVAFLTGRPERCRADTREWLARQGWGTASLFMRPGGDRRPAALVKVEWLRLLAADRRIHLVLDDDPTVVERAEAAGYPVRLATWGRTGEAVDRTLREAQETEGRT